MSGLTLDAGALIAVERNDPRTKRIIGAALAGGESVHALPEVIAQVWRSGPRSARLSRLLAADGVSSPSYDGMTARAVGEMAGVCGHSDIVDVHVALHAKRHGHVIITSDPDDFRAIDPRLPLIII